MNLSRLRKPLAMFGIMFGLAVSTQAEAIIVIRGRNGGCFCIGNADACALACGFAVANVPGYTHVALAVDGASYEGDSLSVTDIADDGTGLVALLSGDEVVFQERVVLEAAVVSDLEAGTENTLAALADLVSCKG